MMWAMSRKLPGDRRHARTTFMWMQHADAKPSGYLARHLARYLARYPAASASAAGYLAKYLAKCLARYPDGLASACCIHMNVVLACLRSPGNFLDIAHIIARSRRLAIHNLARISITLNHIMASS